MQPDLKRNLKSMKTVSRKGDGAVDYIALLSATRMYRCLQERLLQFLAHERALYAQGDGAIFTRYTWTNAQNEIELAVASRAVNVSTRKIHSRCIYLDRGGTIKNI